MRVLIACEYSGVVRDAFRKKGHDAWSCDIIDGDGDTTYHIKNDVLKELNNNYDLMIAHPPCTYLCVSGNAWFYHPEDKHLPTTQRRPHPRFLNRRQQREDAFKFVKALWECDIPRICIENPIGVLSTQWMKYSQKIEPFDFGDPHKKPTCLWLKGLPKLQKTHNSYNWDTLTSTDNMKAEMVRMKNGQLTSKFHHDTFYLPKEERGHVRSKTFQGIADAMASQWGNIHIE